MSFPPIDPAKAAMGAGLYDMLCSGCHLPALTPEIAARQGSRRQSSGRTSSRSAGTTYDPMEDPARTRRKRQCLSQRQDHLDKTRLEPIRPQGNVLARRSVDIAGARWRDTGETSPGLGIDIDVCQAGR